MNSLSLAAVSAEVQELLAIDPKSILPVLQPAIFQAILVIVLNLVAFTQNRHAARALSADQKAFLRGALSPSLYVGMVIWFMAALLLGAVANSCRSEYVAWFVPHLSLVLGLSAFVLNLIRRMTQHGLPRAFVRTMSRTSLLLVTGLTLTLGYTDLLTAKVRVVTPCGMPSNNY